MGAHLLREVQRARDSIIEGGFVGVFLVGDNTVSWTRSTLDMVTWQHWSSSTWWGGWQPQFAGALIASQERIGSGKTHTSFGRRRPHDNVQTPPTPQQLPGVTILRGRWWKRFSVFVPQKSEDWVRCTSYLESWKLRRKANELFWKGKKKHQSSINHISKTCQQTQSFNPMYD